MKRLISVVVFILFLCGSASALTLADLRFLTADKLAQDTSATTKAFSDATLNAWINGAIRTISKMALCYSKDTTVIFLERKTDYAMPSDYIKAEAIVLGQKGNTGVLDVSPMGLIPVSGSILGKGLQQSTIKVPQQFQDRGEAVRKVRVAPAPSLTYDSVTVTYFAYSRSLTTDTMECTLPLSFQYVVPHLAAADSWSKTRRENPFWQEFVNRLSILVPASVKPVEQEPPSSQTQP